MQRNIIGIIHEFSKKQHSCAKSDNNLITKVRTKPRLHKHAVNEVRAQSQEKSVNTTLMYTDSN